MVKGEYQLHTHVLWLPRIYKENKNGGKVRNEPVVNGDAGEEDTEPENYFDIHGFGKRPSETLSRECHVVYVGPDVLDYCNVIWLPYLLPSVGVEGVLFCMEVWGQFLALGLGIQVMCTMPPQMHTALGEVPGCPCGPSFNARGNTGWNLNISLQWWCQCEKHHPQLWKHQKL